MKKGDGRKTRREGRNIGGRGRPNIPRQRRKQKIKKRLAVFIAGNKKCNGQTTSRWEEEEGEM